MAAAKLTVTHKVSWVPSSGDSIVFTGQEALSQVGNDAIERTQAFTSTTSAVNIGNCTGAKYVGVKNITDLGTTPTQTQIDNATLYIDIVTPVVTSGAQIKLPPGKATLFFTAQDTWYGITGSAGASAVVFSAEL